MSSLGVAVVLPDLLCLWLERRGGRWGRSLGTLWSSYSLPESPNYLFLGVSLTLRSLGWPIPCPSLRNCVRPCVVRSRGAFVPLGLLHRPLPLLS